MSKPPYRIGRSNTGLGLFATQPIEKGKLIVVYRGRRIDNDEALELEKRNSRYIFEINSRWSIDGSSRRNMARYVNHSHKPNAEAADHRKTKGICYIARRRIKPGEEITVHYGRDYVDLFFGGKKGCRCAPCLTERSVLRSKRIAAKKRSRARKKKQ